MLNSIWCVFSIVFIALAGCTCSPQKPGSGSSQDAAQQQAANDSNSGGGGKTVNLAIWSNYIPPSLILEFEKASGYKVEISNYSSNEELLAKLQAGATGYDVAVPSDYMVAIMIKSGLLESFALEKIPNHKGIEARYKNLPFDPQNFHSLPYNWIITGIGINRTRYPETVTGWGDLFDNPKAKGKISLLDDVRETLGAALKWQGKSLNTVDPATLEEAKKVLLKVRPHVKAFNSEPMDAIISGDVALAHMYSSDALQAQRKSGGKVQFVIPKEGATIAIDNLVIPKGAGNIEGAHQLINFLLSAAANQAMVENIMAGPVVKGVSANLSKELQENPVLFPPNELLGKCETMVDLGETTTLYDRIWTEIKAGAM